jgi:hypothetical protein
VDAERDLPEELYDRLRDAAHFATPPATLARLALSDTAADLADAARGMVDSGSDEDAVGGEFVEAAARMVATAADVLAYAVVYERAHRHASWAEVGAALGISRQAAQERFSPAVRRWEEGLDAPYAYPERDPAVAPPPVPPGWEPPRPHANLPDAALEPARAARRLDRWVLDHRQPGGADDTETPVSGVLAHDQMRAVRLLNAVLATGERLTRRLRSRTGGHHPIHERIQLERRIACYEAALADDPGQADTARALAEARVLRDALRGRGDPGYPRARRPGLRAVPAIDLPYDSDESRLPPE